MELKFSPGPQRTRLTTPGVITRSSSVVQQKCCQILRNRLASEPPMETRILFQDLASDGFHNLLDHLVHIGIYFEEVYK